MYGSVYEGQASECVKKPLFFTGTTAVKKGQGLCYERDYTSATIDGDAATDPSAYRDKRVELPTGDNQMFFAGVAASDYTANDSGQWIEVDEPGGITEIACPVATTVGSTMLTASLNAADTGMFTRQGFNGRGTALALQTKAVLTDDDDSLVGPVGASLDGTASVNAATLTKTALFTYAAVGDRVIILAGCTTADGAANVTAGEYTITAITSADEAVLDSAASAAASVCAVYVVRGHPTILAKLLDGDESGLQQTVAPKVSGAVVPALVAGGTTYIIGGATLAGASTATLAAGGAAGILRKQFYLDATLTTNGVAVTPHTADKLIDGADNGTTATWTLITATMNCLLNWVGDKWIATGYGTAA